MAKAALHGARRPVLDVRLPGHPQSLWSRLDALSDDYKPFAVEDVDIDITSSPTVHCRRIFFFSKNDRDQAFQAIEHLSTKYFLFIFFQLGCLFARIPIKLNPTMSFN